MNMNDVGKIYNQNKKFWIREELPKLQGDFVTRPESLRVWRNILKTRNIASVLDLGCADGYITEQLDDPQIQHIYGVDLSSDLIQNAKEHNKNNKISYSTGDALKLSESFKKKVDAVITIFMLQYFNIHELRHAIQQMNLVLNEGGVLIISTLHPFMGMKEYKSGLVHTKPMTNLTYWDNISIETELRDVDGNSFQTEIVHNTFSDIINSIINAGFKIEQLTEPLPSGDKQVRDLLVAEYKLPSSITIVAHKNDI